MASKGQMEKWVKDAENRIIKIEKDLEFSRKRKTELEAKIKSIPKSTTKSKKKAIKKNTKKK